MGPVDPNFETRFRTASAELRGAADRYAEIIAQGFGQAGTAERVPTFRAYYSDRTAVLMAVMCRYAYTVFEQDRTNARLLHLQVESHGLKVKGRFAAGGTEGFVAESPEMVILAFRGTTDKADWRTNLRARNPKTVLVKGRPPVCVHEGFLRAYEAVQAEVERLLAGVKDKPIYITGHSLGGAVAVVAAMSLARDEIAACYTFGAPRVGDRSFDEYVKAPHYRVVNGLDAVPLVPFSIMRYSHGGDPRYIRKGQVDAARWNRPVLRAILVNFVAMIELVFRKTPAGIRDHSIELYGEILYRIAVERGGWK